MTRYDKAALSVQYAHSEIDRLQSHGVTVLRGLELLHRNDLLGRQAAWTIRQMSQFRFIIDNFWEIKLGMYP